jgi:RHS repeat-associated protein
MTPWGGVSSVSNPYHPGDAMYWTTTTYDALGRITQMTMPGGASSATSYAGNQTTVTDPAAGRTLPPLLRGWARVAGQERDQETGLDFFQTRYFGAALGRFTSPDEPLAGQDPYDGQSWNLYSYGSNNPLRYADPDGHESVDKSGGPTFYATATAHRDIDPLEELLYRSLFQTTYQMVQLGQQTQQALDWLSAPRDPGCMTARTAGGAATGLAGVY